MSSGGLIMVSDFSGFVSWLFVVSIVKSKLGQLWEARAKEISAISS